jgi:hypothetical protein
MAQSVSNVDGMLWELESPAAAEGAKVDGTGSITEIIVVDPEGEGIEAAAVALHLRATYRHRREQGIGVDLWQELAAIGEAAHRIPGRRPVGAILVRIDGGGRIDGVRCGMGALRHIVGEKVSPFEERAEERDAPPGVVGPVFSIGGTLAKGGLLLVATNGLGGRRLDHEGVAAFVARARGRGEELSALASDAATWARGDSPEAAPDDVVVIVAERVA